MWIVELSVDLIACRLVVAITADPDRRGVERRLEFRSVGNLNVARYHEPGDVCFGNVEKIGTTPIGDGRARYVLDTGDALVTFEAAEIGDLAELLSRIEELNDRMPIVQRVAGLRG